jgi:hypothetical protein
MDQQLVEQLVAKKVIDDQLARAVMMVDFTHGMFSAPRCDVLKRIAPKLDAANAPKNDPAGLKTAIKKVLAQPPAGSADQALLTNLDRSASDFEGDVATFLNACAARAADASQKAAYAKDMQSILSVQRNLGRQLVVFEFSESMPTDDLRLPPSTHLDPKTCKLVTE